MVNNYNYNYGTIEYFLEEKKKAAFKLELMREAIDARIIKGLLTSESLTSYAQILKELETQVESSCLEYNKKLKEKDHDSKE